MTYQSAYVVSFLLVILFRVVQGLSGQANSFEINAVYFNVINISVAIIYAIDVFILNPTPQSWFVEDGDNRSKWDMFQSSFDAPKSTLFDVFTMSRSAGFELSRANSGGDANAIKSDPLKVHSNLKLFVHATIHGCILIFVHRHFFRLS